MFMYAQEDFSGRSACDRIVMLDAACVISECTAKNYNDELVIGSQRKR